MLAPPQRNFNNPSASPYNPADIPIIHELYDAYGYWNEILIKFPKSQRYILGQTCSQYLLETLEYSLACAQTFSIAEKITHAGQASIKLDTLKLLVRLSKDCKCMSNTQYLQMESHLQAVGRNLGAWIKDLKKRQNPIPFQDEVL